MYILPVNGGGYPVRGDENRVGASVCVLRIQKKNKQAQLNTGYNRKALDAAHPKYA